MTTKSRLRDYLAKHTGDWLSGEYLSEEMNVSRAAIWKHIRTLRDEGFVIESVTNKGYRLVQIANALDQDQVTSGLTTRLIGRKDVVILKQTESTNLYAKLLASQGAPDGTIVIADRQTMGKGRLGRVWCSPPHGGIYLSMILRPGISPDKAPRITLMTAVSLAESLLALAPIPLRIKWPNDIMVKDRKLAGILTEIAFEMDRIEYVIVGVGINVNSAKEDFDEDSRGIATSVVMETGHHLDRNRLVSAFLNQFEKDYLLFCKEEFAPILGRWKQLANVIGKKITVDALGTIREGHVVDIDNNGILILKDAQGTLHSLFSGDVIKIHEK